MLNFITCYLLIVSFLSHSIKGQILSYVDETEENIRDSATVIKEWEETEVRLKNLVNSGLKQLLPSFTDGSQSSNISSTCVRDLMQVVAGMKKLKTWALRFLDSTAKGMDGLISGTVVFYGSYDECLDTVAINQRSGKHKGEVMFTGKYCILRMKPHLPPPKPFYKEGVILDELKNISKKGTFMSKLAEYAPLMYSFSFRAGVCVPSGCSVDDVNQIFSKAGDSANLYMKVKKCEVKEEPKYTNLMIVVMWIYSFAGFLVLLGTLTEFYFYYFETNSHSTCIKLILAFSIMTNFRKLVDTSNSSNSLLCLNGIRFMSLSWVILLHSYLMMLSQYIGSLEYIRAILKHDFAMQAFTNATLSVTTFFYLGGFLLCYITTKNCIIAKKKFSIPLYIFHRFWRILPTMAFVMIYTFIALLGTSGPTAHDVYDPVIESCRTDWWAVFLFVQNYVYPSHACFTHGWYLAVDMQLYIASLIILLPLMRWPKVGITIAVFSIVASMVACGVITYLKDLPPVYVVSNINPKQTFQWFADLYMKPYSHIGPYVIGILSGYFVAMSPNLKLPKFVQSLGWCCAIFCSTSALYGAYDWHNGEEASFWNTMLFSSCHKVAWSLGLAWMVICCTTGHGGIVNYILSWPAWIPLARLSYMAYLVHMFVVLGFSANFRGIIAPKHLSIVWIFFGNLMASFGVAFVGNMLIEAPIMKLETLILSRLNKNKHRRTEKEVNNTLDITGVVSENCINTSNGNVTLGSYKGTENGAFLYKL